MCKLNQPFTPYCYNFSFSTKHLNEVMSFENYLFTDKSLKSGNQSTELTTARTHDSTLMLTPTDW